MTGVTTTAVLGAGVIGSSWAALFAAAGMDVRIYDVSPTVRQDVNEYVNRVWPTLVELALAVEGRKGAITFHESAAEAVAEAQFVQENVPERIEVKHALYSEIEPHIIPGAIVCSSASGLMVSEMQQGWNDPSRFILGHPFNPPHLIPLVELLANDKTDEDVLRIAEEFYAAVGKVTIRVQREVPGHVANRLQAALWREAIHLVESGVASVADVDRAVWAGPGLRWAAMGPHMLFHLGAGPGGLEEFCNRYRASFHRWWDDLSDTRLSEQLAADLAAGIDDEAAGRSVADLSKTRDDLIAAMLRANSTIRR